MSQLNSLSELKITQRFVVSSKTGSGIEEMKTALEGMVPVKAVPLSYEKLLTELRARSTMTNRPYIMSEEAELLGLEQVRLCP